MRGQDINKRLARLAAGALLALGAGAALAQAAGEVEFARGVGFAQAAGQAPRTLGKGLPLQQGDRITTSEGASAIVKLADGTRMTVRPNSEIVLSQYQFKENAPDNGMLLQMIRGGFRAVTGLIAKSSPHAAKVQTSTATIGIRGTDFDARLCARDCGAESGKVAEKARPNAVLASAKVVQSQGEVYAVDAGNQRRRLVDGGSIYPGDVVETGAGTRAVIAFRDDTRITLGSSTRFRVDNFVYDEQNAGEGRFLVSVLRGTVRALTGLIAKANNRNVGFSTATATIGIRGTGLDISCTGACAGEPSGRQRRRPDPVHLAGLDRGDARRARPRCRCCRPARACSSRPAPASCRSTASRRSRGRGPTAWRCRPSCSPRKTCPMRRRACSCSCATATSRWPPPARCCTWARARRASPARAARRRGR